MSLAFLTGSVQASERVFLPYFNGNDLIRLLELFLLATFRLDDIHLFMQIVRIAIHTDPSNYVNELVFPIYSSHKQATQKDVQQRSYDEIKLLVNRMKLQSRGERLRGGPFA
jgi:hypothetical protein